MRTRHSARTAIGSARFLVARLGLLALGLAAPVPAQTVHELTIPTSLGDTETFWLQIPAGYDSSVACPLLVGWHQLGGDHWELANGTAFDVEANARGWIAASHRGVTTTHWNNHATQTHVVDMIRWIGDHYAVDPRRIYMVGASMGGAAGMVFAANHLDPAGPLVAAAASLSGIQDCERRFHEQGTNTSMIGAFGGTPEEVPYEYHRNSAICFADSTVSLHRNGRHLPLWLTFGRGDSDQVWREHAEDLYAVMVEFADTVVLRESARTGHGWACAEEQLICDFLSGFELDPRPVEISVNADEEGAWHWTRLEMRQPVEAFARFEARVDAAAAYFAVTMVRNISRLDVDLAALAFDFQGGWFDFRWRAGPEGPAQLGVSGVPAQPGLVLRAGEPFTDWQYDSGLQSLVFTSQGEAEYRVFLGPSALDDFGTPGQGPGMDLPRICSLVRLDDGLACRLPCGSPASWALFDAAGRGISRGRTDENAASLRLPSRLASGTYLLRVKLAGSPARELVRRVVILR